MDFLTKVFAAILGRVASDELKAWCPSITEFLVNLAVRRLPKDLRERYAEEWRAHVNEVPGAIGKVFCAARFIWAGWRVWEGFRFTHWRSYSTARWVLIFIVVQSPISIGSVFLFKLARKEFSVALYLGLTAAWLVVNHIFGKEAGRYIRNKRMKQQ